MRFLLVTFLLLSAISRVVAKDNSFVFIENIGQFTDQYHKQRTDIDFALRSGGLNVFIQAGSIHYQFMKAAPQETKDMPFDPVLGRVGGKTGLLGIHRVDVELLGANKNVQPIKEGRLQYYERYYTPQFSEQGGMAHAYSRIVYKNIYPNIDWILYINGDQIEYDFVVRQGGDPADIQIKYNGVNSLNIDKEGNLIAITDLGNIKENAPTAWQEDGRQINTSFRIKDNIASFDVASYSGTLLIDPYIEWATYYGGAGKDGGGAITEDDNGNVYMYGTTYSAANIATSGAHDVSYADSGDIYLVKFMSSGMRIWGTYYGGPATDLGIGLTYDHNGHVYLSGSTNNSNGIATTGSDQSIFSGAHGLGLIPFFLGDAFLAKFDTNGIRVWGTYFGGNDKEAPGKIKCDSSGNVYMTGATYSTSNIATNGAHQFNKDVTSNTSDGFLVKYNSSGQKVWATYYGGDLGDLCYDVDIFQGNKIYIGGYTQSSNNIGTTGTYKDILPSMMSGFLAGFNENGSRLWGTYIGGNTSTAATRITSVSCNSNGDIFLGGSTDDPSGIATVGCHQYSYGGDGIPSIKGDVYFAKFTSSGNIIWCTYLGGSGGERGASLACNQLGDVYVSGITASPNNIALNAFQGNYMGGGPLGTDGLLAKFNDAGACIWSTYLGGNGDDLLGGIDISTNNFIYVSGNGVSFPTTPGSHQQNIGGDADGYLAKFKDFPTGISAAHQPANHFNTYPVPNNGTFTVEGTVETDQQLTLTVTAINGTTVHTENIRTTTGHFSKQISLPATLSPGIYTLQVISGNTTTSHRFLKQ